MRVNRLRHRETGLWSEKGNEDVKGDDDNEDEDEDQDE
jgi:hypothetical protein